MCAFSLVVVKVKLFFPLYRRRACVYYHTQEQKRSSLLKFLFQQILTHSGGEGGVREGQIFLKRSLTLSLTLIFSFSSSHQHKEEIYIHNNAVFPRVIP